jgi:uncharacterized membrane protein YtjA (UPF0391 family)
LVGETGRGRRPAAAGVIAEGCAMLRWAVIFLIIALVAGALLFAGVPGSAATVARIVFIAFLIFAALFLIVALVGIGGIA